MFIFLAGLLVGSFSMIFIMSHMVAAKKGDHRLEMFQNERAYQN